MSLLVLAYPEIKKDDFEWIQEIRSKHDELYYHVVDPHFTIVFPYPDNNRQVFASHVKKHASEVQPFQFHVRSAVIVKNSFNEYTDTFLVPDEGYMIACIRNS